MPSPLNTMTTLLSSKKNLPLYRSINGLAVLSRYFAKQGIDLDLLIEGTQLQADDLYDPDFLVTPEQEMTVIRNIIRLVPEQGLGLRIGRQYHTGALGMVGIAAIHSDTLLDALQIIYQFDDLLPTYFHFDLKVKDNLVFFTMKELLDLNDIRFFVCEMEFASMDRVTSDLIGIPIQLKEMRIAYPEPEYSKQYQDLFQCPLRFNAKSHMFVFEKSYLYRPLPMANPLARKAYEKECRALSLRLKKQGTVSKRAYQEILFHRNEIPDFNQLARYLNTSNRTLRRRLKEEGTSYKDLVSSIQKKKAINLLQTTFLSIGEIATEMGYKDLANFYRAFKHWTGKNPGDYRSKKTNLG
jgi:AraC-like DNA-binding protein